MNENKELKEAIYESGFALTPRGEHIAEYFFEKGKTHRNKCELCNEPPLTQREKDWIKENVNKP